MAVTSRVATIKVDNSLGSTRTWQATAAVQDTAAGSSVVTTITDVSTGATPPGIPDNTYDLIYVNDDGTVIRTVALAVGAGSQTNTFFFTNTGLSGGTARAGIIEIRLRVTRTSGGPASTYDIESDGAPNTPPSTFTTTQLDRGWMRGTTAATLRVTKDGSGGAATATFAYPDTITGIIVLDHTPYVSDNITNTLGPVSAALTSATTTFQGALGAAGNNFPAAATVYTPTHVVGNATLTGLPWTVLTTVTPTDATVDPRMRRVALFQLDDNTFGTPPSIKNVADHLRLASEQGFLAERLINSRSEGVNGITYTITLTPEKPGSTLTETGKVTTTQGGETGWAPTFLAWQSSLPGGTWNKALTITAPATITGATYTSLAAGENSVYSLVAINPNLRTILTANRPAAATASGARHFEPGQQLSIIFHVVDRSTGIRLAGASITNPRCAFTRNNPDQAQPGTHNGRQYLGSDTDNTSAAWVLWTPAAAIVTYPLTVSPADSTVYERVFSATSGWAYRDIIVSAICEVDGAVYGTEILLELTGVENRHDGYGLDAVGLALTGGLTFK